MSIKKYTATLSMLNITWSELSLLFGITFLTAIFEGFGVGLLLPVLQYIEQGASVISTESTYWRAINNAHNFLGITTGLESLLVITLIPIVIRQVIYYYSQIYSAKVHQLSIERLRREGVDVMLSADYSFFKEKHSAAIISGLTVHADRGGWAIHALARFLNVVALIIVYCLLILWLSPILLLFGLFIGTGVWFVVRKQIKKSNVLGQEIARYNNNFYERLSELLGGIRLVKMAGKEKSAAEQLKSFIAGLRGLTVNISRAKALVEIMVEPILIICSFVALYIAIEHFGLRLSDMGIFLLIVFRITPNIKEMNVNRHSFQSAAGSLEDVLRLIKRMKHSKNIIGGNREFSGLRYGIKFRNAGYIYINSDNSKERILKDISFEIPKGAMVAIVGRSGAGKSTLVDLIPRLLDPTEGDILFDDIPISEFSLNSLRRSIGFVTQETFLFNDTVFNNIAFACPYASAEMIHNAAIKAHAHEFIIKLPHGYDTVVGERGVRLSGGERQRIGLARALVNDPEILILDEPTSALDSESEKHIMDAIRELHGFKTIIVIAHRLSIIREADRIIVLKDSKIVEAGTHDSLFQQEQEYRKLFDL